MALSCDCGGDYDWYYSVDDEEVTAERNGYCYGCCDLICIGEEVRTIYEHKFDENGDEEDHNWLGYLCAPCCGLYDRFMELGFCVDAYSGFIKDAISEYREMLPPRHIMKREENVD